LKETNPHLEIVQYSQCGHHAHRMITLEERFIRDLEDFIEMQGKAVEPYER
jgi:hypothetical protein